jgi:hypothetical protein
MIFVSVVSVMMSAESSTAAKQLFDAGRQHAKAGRTEQACAAFAQSLDHQRALGTLMNLAACSERLERFADAWRYADEAAMLAGPTSDPREGVARSLQQRVERGVAFIEVHAQALPPGAEAVVLGVSSPLAAPVTQVVVPTGELEVVLRAPGQLTVSKRVMLDSKEVVRLSPWSAPLETLEQAQAFSWFSSGPVPGVVKLSVLRVGAAFPYFGVPSNGCAGGGVFVNGVLEEVTDGLPKWTSVVVRLRSSVGVRVGTSASFKQLRRAGLGRDRTPVLCEAGL